MTQPNDFNQKIIEQFRANGGKVGPPFSGAPMVLITTKGAKTGRLSTTPLVPLVDGDRLVIIASKGGAPKHPAWYHNIVANPTLTVEYLTEKFEADARIAEGTERDELYARQAQAFPAFAEYERKTNRKIPVVVLTRKK
jgi:deazaflavin-dependent oxidoreductase (nitroreductase family)